MKTIFITGTSSGLGSAAVRLFHSKGWKVIATMRNTEKGNIFSDLEGVEVLALDITNPEQIKTTVASALALGDVDVVLNNAAYGAIGPLESMTDEQLVKQIDTNLLGAIRVTQAFVPHFRVRESGLFINITSIAGLVTFPFASIYNAVKYGMQGWSEGMSYELSRFGIGIKTVAPGFIRTEFGSNTEITSTEPYQKYVDKNMSVVASMMDPATSGSTAEEVAEVVYEAATDGKDQVHYMAGTDSKDMYARRLEVGPEVCRKEMSVIFLG
ncbi:SDR family oxidoreductase [Dyadobacter frigoris]|uniref:SDR family oxidoreductase n=1 Tax=Dyadobacter frigoris TaxID=2576211 RepID=A0A4U6CZP0_9BACT|nr:SDR family oxidoreductase [Dyadobacter frigoris]TKT88868.1 SDR family oxidoreductase [Dyadobacter frigoris]GLU56060.1 short-chain dehydrogenase/reductase [Dyadobacter frigoris]